MRLKLEEKQTPRAKILTVLNGMKSGDASILGVGVKRMLEEATFDLILDLSNVKKLSTAEEKVLVPLKEIAKASFTRFAIVGGSPIIQDAASVEKALVSLASIPSEIPAKQEFLKNKLDVALKKKNSLDDLFQKTKAATNGKSVRVLKKHNAELKAELIELEKELTVFLKQNSGKISSHPMEAKLKEILQTILSKEGFLKA